MAPAPALNIERDTCIMYLVRHGATANNLADPPILQGRGIDLELSEQGRGQAESVARLLAPEALAGVYSSRLVRARQTAEIIARRHELPVGLVDDIEEIDVGQWEGRSWSEISKTDPGRYQQFITDSATHGYLGGENMTQVLERCAPALTSLMAKNLGSKIVVVAHNVINRVFAAKLLGIPMSQAREIHQDNCGVNVVRFRRDRTKLMTLNASFHLR